MTIHEEHPFVPPEGDRDPLRRLRGRLPAAVTVWSTGEGRERAGLTVSSLLVAEGEPARILALIDDESSLWDADPDAAVVSVLGPDHRFLADAFAGLAPAPGGPFTLGSWAQEQWGPRLVDATGWLGIRIDRDEVRPFGWNLLVTGVIEHVEVAGDEVLTHVRGRYRT